MCEQHREGVGSFVCGMLYFSVSKKCFQLQSSKIWNWFLRKYTQKTQTHRVFSSRALLRCNPNSISSFSPVMIFSITWEMSVVRPQQPRSVYVCCRLFDHSPKRLLFGTQFYSKRCSFSFSLSLNNSKNSCFFVCEKAVLLLSCGNHSHCWPHWLWCQTSDGKLLE